VLRPIRALIVSDVPDHAELLRALRRVGFDPSWRHTSTIEGFTAALACDRFDIVFADVNAQGMPGTHALEVLKRSGLDIPCLVVSAVAREDLIVDMMRAGAADYLVTNHWARLAQRVDRALGDAAARGRRAAFDTAAPQAPGRVHRSGGDTGHTENVSRAASAQGEPITDEGARQRLILDVIPQIVWMAGADGSTHYLNRPGTERLGVPAEAIYGWHWLDWLHPDDVNRARERWEVAIRETGDYVNEYRLRQADGTYRWYLAQAVALRDPEGTVTEWVGTWTDITDRKWTEERLVQDATLLANVLDSLIVTDRDGLVTYWNEGATRLFGWTAAEMVGRPLLERFPPHMRPQIAALTDTILDGQEWAGEFEDYRKDGSRVWIDARVARMTDGAGQVTGVIGVARDSSGRKQAEAERDRLLAQLRVQIDRMPLGYLLLDADFRIVDWNPAAERLFGYRKDEMVGLILPIERLLPAAAVPQGEAVLRRLQRGDMAAHAINENLTKDGRTITCEWHNTPLFDANGTIVGVLALAQDISDRQRAEEGLRASEQRFREIAESIREVFWLTDPLKQEIVYVSPAYETIWGRTSASLYASPEQWWEAIHTEDRAFVLQAVGAKQLRGDYDEQYRIVRPDGTIRWIRDRAFPVRDVHGQVCGSRGAPRTSPSAGSSKRNSGRRRRWRPWVNSPAGWRTTSTTF
jgi:PAS domain S-box-containing protein